MQELKHFVCAHRGFQYAVPVTNVIEIVEVPSLLPFHGRLRGVLGNMVHREHLLPVLDATELCTGLGPDAGRPVPLIVVLQRDGVLCALAIDRYIAVVALNAQDAVVGDDVTAIAGDRPLYVETVLGFRNNALIVLSVPALTGMVREQFGNQHVLREDGDATGPVEDVADADADGSGFLCARIGSVVLGIPIEPVLEVIENYEVTPLFLVDPSLRGLINLRGQVLAVLDVSGDLDLPLRTLEEVSQFVIVRADDIEFALCVDKVIGQRRIRSDQIESADALMTGELSRYLSGLHQSASGPILTISVPNILRLTRLQSVLSQPA